ncbi:sentrin-specific protease 8 [Culex quinquefasciatus]|uniref:Sentrin-specific protease 8 n=1 Tax=Culex quinquefasciatus TaxID=7176 RepID=B0XF62_CULQU|nr:sentrin-specific protease 8 [Culex quinquefasciatus]|eukprot:XP_001868284.1 sentrin-specific protease 8 [Culex quinquefasciatus]
MSSYRGDQVALSFHESCLRLADVELLKGPFWLNDQIISFYFEYLEKQIYKDEDDILFVSPEVTQCIRMVSEAEVGVFLDPLRAKQRAFIFFALNDNQIADRAGGSHWSLLVFSRPERAFYHFDSSHHSNSDICRQFVGVLKRALDCPEAQLRTGDCLQQSNGYDCGVHVLCTVDKVIQQVRKSGRIEGVKSARYDVIRGKREEILNMIIELGGRIN